MESAAQLLSKLPFNAVLLPTGWEARVAPSGAHFFFEHASGVCALDAPTMAAACGLPPAALLPNPRAPPLSAGWVVRVSRTTGLPYALVR